MSKSSEAYNKYVTEWETRLQWHNACISKMISLNIPASDHPPTPEPISRQSFFDGWDAAMKHLQQGNIERELYTKLDRSAVRRG